MRDPAAGGWNTTPGAVSYFRLAGPLTAVYDKPECMGSVQQQLPGGTLVALLGVEGASLKVGTNRGVGYIERSAPRTWED